MNVNAIKIDETKCAVIDEQGNIKIVNSNSNEKLEELLLKENELENVNTNIEKCKKDIEVNKNNTINAEVKNVLAYVVDILLFTMSFSVIQLPILLSFICIIHLLLKYTNIKCHGTRSSRKMKKNTLNQILKLLEAQIQVLEKQISEIKNNNNYITLNEIKALSNPQIISYENQFENIITYEEKPKVLSIGQKKNEK